MTDPVDVVRQVAPPAEVPSELLERVRNDLMATITEPEPTPTERPLRRPRRRLAAIRGRRRLTTVVAITAVLLAGAAVVLLAAPHRRATDVDVTTRSVDKTPEMTDTTEPAHRWPDCTDADVDVVPGEDGSFTLVPKAGMQPCLLTLLSTMTFRDEVTGELVPGVEPNPLHGDHGIVWGQPDQGPLTMPARDEHPSIFTAQAALVQCRGIDPDKRYIVTSDMAFGGFGPPPQRPWPRSAPSTPDPEP
jgi:hypothetical protein